MPTDFQLNAVIRMLTDKLEAAEAERDELRAALQYARNLIGPDEIIDATLNKEGGDE